MINNEDSKIKMLLRSYPIEPSGMCSKHRVGDDAGTCSICWPDLSRLIEGHARVNGEIVDERNSLRERVKSLEKELLQCKFSK